MLRGKKYLNKQKGAVKTPVSLSEGIKSVKLNSYSSFDGTVELKMALNSANAVRFSVTYPNSFSKEQRILVFTDDSKKDIAVKAGAMYVGLEEYINKIKDGWFEFDIVIATPSVMAKIAILGKYLGTRGLMPNPKAGTITDDVETAIKTYKAGKTDFKTDKSGVLHVKVGKISMKDEELLSNIEAAMKEFEKSTGKNIRSMLKSSYLVPTMGQSVKVVL